MEGARSPGEVWDAIADYSFDLQWRKGLREMTPDPPGQPASGTKVHEVVRSSGRDYIADTVVTDLDPGVSYRFTGMGTIGGIGGVEADPRGTGAVHLRDRDAAEGRRAPTRPTSRPDRPLRAEEGSPQAQSTARQRPIDRPGELAPGVCSSSLLLLGA